MRSIVIISLSVRSDIAEWNWNCCQQISLFAQSELNYVCGWNSTSRLSPLLHTAALLPLPKTWKNPFEADNLIHSLSERWKSLHHCEVSKRFVYETVSSICGIQSSVCVGKSLMKNAPTLHSLRGGTSTCEDTEKRERRTRRMLERNKCKVNEPRAKRKHRRFTIMTSKLVSLSLTLCVNFTA